MHTGFERFGRVGKKMKACCSQRNRRRQNDTIRMLCHSNTDHYNCSISFAKITTLKIKNALEATYWRNLSSKIWNVSCRRTYVGLDSAGVFPAGEGNEFQADLLYVRILHIRTSKNRPNKKHKWSINKIIVDLFQRYIA